jgi:hypothetical protein
MPSFFNSSTEIFKIAQNLTDVLGGSHWVIVLVPASHLMVIDREEVRHKRDEVDELLTWVAALQSEKRS